MALQRDAEHIEVSPEMRRRLDARLGRGGSSFRSRALALSVAAVVVAAGVAVWLIAGPGEEKGTLTGTPAPSPDQYFEGYWPVSTRAAAEALQRKVDGGEESWRRDPVAVAKKYTETALGWTVSPDAERLFGIESGTWVAIAPMIGESTQKQRGPEHRVALTYLEGADRPVWFVMGITSPNIMLEEPRPNATITSPVRVAGSGVAFEGNILAAVVPDSPIGNFGGQPIQAGGTEPMPFETTLSFPQPKVPAGIVHLKGGSGLEGPSTDVTIVRVRFGETSAAEVTPRPNNATVADERTSDEAFRCFFTARHYRDLEMAKPCMSKRYADSITDPLEFIGPSSPSVERATIISSSRVDDRVVYDAIVYWGSSQGLEFVSEDTITVLLDGWEAFVDSWTPGPQTPIGETRTVTLSFLAPGDTPKCEDGEPTPDSFTTIDRIVGAEAVVDDLALSVVRELATGHWAHESDGDAPLPAATRVERVSVTNGVAIVELNRLTRFGGCGFAREALRQSLLRLDGITDVELREAAPQEVPSEPDV